MALKKSIRSGNGLVLDYHRISQLDIETNVGVGIWTASYTSQSERARELDPDNEELVFSENTYFHETWDEGPKTVDEAYEWLKNHELFEGAEDC